VLPDARPFGRLAWRDGVEEVLHPRADAGREAAAFGEACGGVEKFTEGDARTQEAAGRTPEWQEVQVACVLADTGDFVSVVREDQFACPFGVDEAGAFVWGVDGCAEVRAGERLGHTRRGPRGRGDGTCGASGGTQEKRTDPGGVRSFSWREGVQKVSGQYTPGSQLYMPLPMVVTLPGLVFMARAACAVVTVVVRTARTARTARMIFLLRMQELLVG